MTTGRRVMVLFSKNLVLGAKRTFFCAICAIVFVPVFVDAQWTGTYLGATQTSGSWSGVYLGATQTSGGWSGVYLGGTQTSSGGWTGTYLGATQENPAASAVTPFGGRVLAIKPCTCSAGCFLLTVGPPRGGMYMICPWTRLYEWGVFMPPAWQLGMSGALMKCLNPVCSGACCPTGVGKLIIMEGTSIY